MIRIVKTQWGKCPTGPYETLYKILIIFFLIFVTYYRTISDNPKEYNKSENPTLFFFIDLKDCFSCGLTNVLTKDYLIDDSIKIKKILIVQTYLNQKQFDYLKRNFKVDGIIIDTNKFYYKVFNVEVTPTIVFLNLKSHSFIKIESKEQIFSGGFSKLIKNYKNKNTVLFLTFYDTLNFKNDVLIEPKKVIYHKDCLIIFDGLQNKIFFKKATTKNDFMVITPDTTSKFFTDLKRIIYENQLNELANKINPIFVDVEFFDDTLFILCKRYDLEVEKNEISSKLNYTMKPVLYLEKYFPDKRLSIIDSLPKFSILKIFRNFFIVDGKSCSANECSLLKLEDYYLGIIEKEKFSPLIRKEDLFYPKELFEQDTIYNYFRPHTCINDWGNGYILSELNRFFCQFSFDFKTKTLKNKKLIIPRGSLLKSFMYWDSVKPNFEKLISTKFKPMAPYYIAGTHLATNNNYFVLLKNGSEDSARYHLQMYNGEYFIEWEILTNENISELFLAGSNENKLFFVGRTKENEWVLLTGEITDSK